MENLGRIVGGADWNKSVVTLYDAIYVNSNITKLDNGNYEFDCVRYEPNEYIGMVSAENERLENELTDTQMALADTFEASVATADDLTETQLALAEVYELVLGG